MGRRIIVVVVARRRVAAATAAALLTRELGLHGGEQDALLLVPARLRGVVERAPAAVDVELEILDRRACDRRASAAPVRWKHHPFAPRRRWGRWTARWRGIGRGADGELAQGQAKAVA